MTACHGARAAAAGAAASAEAAVGQQRPGSQLRSQLRHCPAARGCRRRRAAAAALSAAAAAAALASALAFSDSGGTLGFCLAALAAPRAATLVGHRRRVWHGDYREPGRPGQVSLPSTQRCRRVATAAVAEATVFGMPVAVPVAADGMYVLPVGPSCPFRSTEMQARNIDRELAQVVSEATRHSGEFAQLAAMFSAGVAPDKAKARQVGTEIVRQGEKLKGVLDELEKSKDFQAIEAYHTLQLTAQRMKMPTLRTVEQVVSWQGYGLLAFADGRPLAPMPQGLDANALAASAPGAAGADPQKRIFSEPSLPRSLPFMPQNFEGLPGPMVAGLRVEFGRLVREHEQLIGLGATYGDFDTAGKEFYLDQMAQVAFRWEELMLDARQEGIIPNPGFRAMSEEYLRRADMTPLEFQKLVSDVHQILRRNVAKEAAAGR